MERDVDRGVGSPAKMIDGFHIRPQWLVAPPFTVLQTVDLLRSRDPPLK